MLYYIFDIFAKSGMPGARLMQYTSFRAMLAIVISLLVSAWFGTYLIKYFKKKQITETLREYDKNNLKAGVPTMGGLIIIIAILVPCLLIGRLDNVYMLLLIITTVWLGILGFADDYIKTFKKNKDGISGKTKI
ncbi:MAG: phospho-N-acetylmuramoyl-pentapeptide-transferase, partial [Bacteroidaceae bacterium]|nr:phospho-N-acetylmuramoyl-pentapeptide-transferase [Bacteroidaceae bacterium]